MVIYGSVPATVILGCSRESRGIEMLLYDFKRSVCLSEDWIWVGILSLVVSQHP